jgi:hypothetical protein
MKFTTHDTNTLMILVINNSKMFCDKSYVYKGVKEFFKTNPEDFSMCNFLFNWEMLKANTNFIILKKIDGIDYLGLQSNYSELTKSSESVEKTEQDLNIDFTIDVSEAIMWACINARKNNQVNLVRDFLQNNFPGYSSVYELLYVNRYKIGNEEIRIFIDYYSDIFDADEIIKLIVAKKLCEWRQSNENSQEIIKKPSKAFNFSYGLFGVTVGIATLLTYKNPWVLRYFKWF